MARLFEYEGKELLREFGIAIPKGMIVSNITELEKALKSVYPPVVVKAQVWSTGRSKTGGVLFANNAESISKAVTSLLGASIKGFSVEKVLIEECLDIALELYAGIIIDDSYRVRSPVMILALEGGIDIEEVAKKSPEKVARATIDKLGGFSSEHALQLTQRINVPLHLRDALAQVLADLYKLFEMYDARSVEINPLAITTDNKIIAADCRISIDDASVYRHPELGIEIPRESDSPPTVLDISAWQIEKQDYRGSSYFAEFPNLNGNKPRIGFHAIGGGGALLAANTIMRKGFALANFAETSGNPPASKVYRISKTILKIPDLSGYCLLGPVMASQDQRHHANGLLKAFREELPDRLGFPIVIMLAGNKEGETLDLLQKGLRHLPVRFKVFGREHLYRLDIVVDQLKEFVDAYIAER